MFAIPRFSLIVNATTGFGRQIFDTVGKRDHFPVPVIKVDSFGARCRTFVQTPGRIHGENIATGICQLIETGCREFRLMGRLYFA